jgi:hypothetical protein
MAFYIVTLNPNKGGRSLRNGSDVMVVSAADATAAKQVAAAKFEGEGNVWTDSSTTATAIAAAADWSGWTVKVAILGGFGAGAKTDPFEVSAVGDATNNTMDKIAALLVTALNASAGIAGAAYDSATNILTVAGTADALGDQQVQAEFIPPGSAEAVPALVGTIVDGGLSSAALTLTLPADAAVIPAVLGFFKQA